MLHAEKFTKAALAAAMAALLAACGQTPAGTEHPSASASAAATPSPAPPAQTAAPVQTSAPPEEPSLKNLKSVAAGGDYSLAVTEDGAVLAWGNYAGAIEGEEYPIDTEKIRIIDRGAVSVAATGDYCAELKADGSLWVWGRNESLCGKGGRKEPAKAMDGVASYSLGSGFVLAVKADGSLWAWGENAYGQLGGSKAARLAEPARVMTGVKKASAGGGFSLILKTDGTLWGCGINSGGQLLSFSNKKLAVTPFQKADAQTVPARLMTGIRDIAAGGGHSLALDSSGNVWAFGYNIHGQVGDNWGRNTTFWFITGVEAGCKKATKVLSGAVSLLASGYGSGAVKADGSLWLWGANENNELGDGGFQASYVPKQILTGVAFASQSSTHGLAVKTDGSLWAWGNNRYGQLGTGYCNQRYEYVKIADDIRQVATNGVTTLAVKNDGSLLAFGGNDHGQLGGVKLKGSSTPSVIMKDVVQAAVGDNAAYCVKSDGSLWSWGNNLYGALGNGKLEESRFFLQENVHAYSNGRIPAGYQKRVVSPTVLHPPAKVLDGVRQILACHGAVYAVKKDNTLWGWGFNEGGSSFADSTTGNTATPAKRMTGIGSVLTMHMVKKTDGSVWTWGETFIGDSARKLGKANISGVAQAVGDAFSYRMALKTDGTLWAWGKFGSKEFKKPVQIEDHVKAISRGDQIFVLTDDNTLYSVLQYSLDRFMEKLNGKQAAHLLQDDSVYKEMDGVREAVSAEPQVSGPESMCSFVIKTDGSLWATGYNKFGQLGDGRAFFTPKQISE